MKNRSKCLAHVWRTCEVIFLSFVQEMKINLDRHITMRKDSIHHFWDSIHQNPSLAHVWRTRVWVCDPHVWTCDVRANPFFLLSCMKSHEIAWKMMKNLAYEHALCMCVTCICARIWARIMHVCDVQSHTQSHTTRAYSGTHNTCDRTHYACENHPEKRDKQSD